MDIDADPNVDDLDVPGNCDMVAVADVVVRFVRRRPFHADFIHLIYRDCVAPALSWQVHFQIIKQGGKQ